MAFINKSVYHYILIGKFQTKFIKFNFCPKSHTPNLFRLSRFRKLSRDQISGNSVRSTLHLN